MSIVYKAGLVVRLVEAGTTPRLHPAIVLVTLSILSYEAGRTFYARSGLDLIFISRSCDALGDKKSRCVSTPLTAPGNARTNEPLAIFRTTRSREQNGPPRVTRERARVHEQQRGADDLAQFGHYGLSIGPPNLLGRKCSRWCALVGLGNGQLCPPLI
jgi:hypothetical protein